MNRHGGRKKGGSAFPGVCVLCGKCRESCDYSHDFYAFCCGSAAALYPERCLRVCPSVLCMVRNVLCISQSCGRRSLDTRTTYLWLMEFLPAACTDQLPFHLVSLCNSDSSRQLPSDIILSVNPGSRDIQFPASSVVSPD